MVRMTSHKCQWARNTSYYGLQVVHCVRRSHQYRILSKTTKYALRVVACSSSFCVSRCIVENQHMVLIGVILFEDIHCFVGLLQDIVIGKVSLPILSCLEEHSCFMFSIT